MQHIRLEEGDGQAMEMVQFEDIRMPSFFEGPERLKVIKELEYQDGDVLICTFPKQGSHWITNLVSCLLSKEPIENYQSKSFPLIDLIPSAVFTSLPRPRVLGTHLKFDRMPEQHFQNGGKTIFLVRNVKDTAVSYYYHMVNMIIDDKKTNVSWAFFLEHFLNGTMPYGSYFDYLDSWEPVLKKRPDILTVMYESLVKDPLKELRTIQTYLGTNKTDEELLKILDRCQLKSLKADIDSGKTRSRLVDEEGKSFLYRKGVIGDWKNHFTVAQNEKIDALIADRLRDSQFSFTYEP